MGEKGEGRGREVGGKGEGTGNGVPPVHPLCMLLRCSHMQLVRLFKYRSDHHCKLISLYACA